MRVSDVAPFKEHLCALCDCPGRNDAAAAVDDAVVPVVAAHDIIRTFKNKKQNPEPLVLRKFDKKVRKHVTYKETKK